MIRTKRKKVMTRKAQEIPSSRNCVASTTKSTSGRIVQTTPTTRVAQTRTRSVLRNLQKRRPPSYDLSRMWRRLKLTAKTLKAKTRPHWENCGQLMPRPRSRSSQEKICTPTKSYTPPQLCLFPRHVSHRKRVDCS